MPPLRASAPHRLIVEGKDDLHTIIHLTRSRGINWDAPDPRLPYVYDAGGIDRVLDAIPVSVKTHDRLGLVVDADHSLEDRWRAIQGRLHEAGVELPATPSIDGTVIVRTTRPHRIGVWIMPSNDAPGTIESFLAGLISRDDRIWPHAVQSTCVASDLGAQFADKDRLKAQIHAWLAWQQNPGRPLGTAITSGSFAVSSPQADSFLAWFQRLFLE